MKQQRLEFCQNIIQKGIDGKNIFFTDETKMEILKENLKNFLTNKK